MGGRANQREGEMMSQAGKDSPTLSGFIDRGRISSRASLSRHILACCQAFGEACRPMRNNRGTKIDLCLGRSEHGSILELLEIWRHRVVLSGSAHTHIPHIRTPRTRSFADCAGRCSTLRTPCTGSFADCAGRSLPSELPASPPQPLLPFPQDLSDHKPNTAST